MRSAPYDYRRCPACGKPAQRVEHVWGEPGRFYHGEVVEGFGFVGTVHEDNSVRLRWSPGPSSILDIAKASSPYQASMDKLREAMADPAPFPSLLLANISHDAVAMATARPEQMAEDLRRLRDRLRGYAELEDNPD